MRNVRFWMVLAVACAAVCSVHAELKPRWLHNTPKELNHTYKFVVVHPGGATVEAARSKAKNELEDDTQLQEGIRIYRNTHEKQDIRKLRVDGGPLQEVNEKTIHVETTVDGEKFNLQAIRVDEYVERAKGGYVVHTLYQVALTESPVFDRAYTSDRYGALPAVMSVIPGVGQLYKGATVKGVGMLAFAALSAGAIVLCENQRSSYVTKMHEQPKYLKTYKNKADNWETARNVAFGVAGVAVVWSVVDAALAPGARRVLLRNGQTLNIRPAAWVDGQNVGLGASLAWRF